MLENSNHIHAYYKGFWGKTPYIISGGAGAPLTESDTEHSFYHYIKIIVTPENVEYVVVKIPFNYNLKK